MHKVTGVVVLAWVLCGCGTPGPVVSKSHMGNLAIYIHAPKGADVRRAELSIDGLCIGDATGERPVLFVKRGDRVIGVRMVGCKAVERKIDILGDPNHQVLHVFLEPEQPGAVTKPAAPATQQGAGMTGP